MLWDPIFGQWPKKELVPNAMQHYITCDDVTSFSGHCIESFRIHSEGFQLF